MKIIKQVSIIICVIHISLQSAEQAYTMQSLEADIARLESSKSRLQKYTPISIEQIKKQTEDTLIQIASVEQHIKEKRAALELRKEILEEQKKVLADIKGSTKASLVRFVFIHDNKIIAPLVKSKGL